MEFTRLVYTDYGIGILQDNPGNIRIDYDQELHRRAWMLLCANEEQKRIYETRTEHKGLQAVVAGYPKFDKLVQRGRDQQFWPIKSAKRQFRLIWAPHHSVRPGHLGFGTFPHVYQDILRWVFRNPDVEVVYTSGTFDMLHINHLHMLEYARGLGDILIVGVNTDELVIRHKSVPIIPFKERIALIRALKGPDIVIPQDSLIHTDKVAKLKFDVFVVGDDWDKKYGYLGKQGVDVVYFPYGRGVSSSRLKKRIVTPHESLMRKATSHFGTKTKTR